MQMNGLQDAVTVSRQGARARAKEDISQRLCNSALSLFVERGYDDVTVNDIAKGAGVTSRTFFRYYPTKETVVIDIMDQTSSRIVDLIGQSPSGTSITHLLERAIRTWHLEYEQLNLILTPMVTGSETLMAAVLLRETQWQRHLANALQEKYPDQDADTMRLWGAIGYSLIRVTAEIMEERKIHSSDALHVAMNSFRLIASDAEAAGSTEPSSAVL